MRVKSKLGDYDVNFWDDIESMIKQIGDGNDIVWIVDENVYSRYNIFDHRPACQPVTHLVCNEELKSFEWISSIVDHFARMKVKSTTTVIAVGGGTLQDAIGFVCSIYNRGIKWKFIPTTLLSMADSCIGGKTSINYRNKKNIIGTYYPPNEVLICSKFLNTLSKEHYDSGMGEIIKFHILSDKVYEDKNIDKLIEWSLRYKQYIIEVDEFDTGYRKILNYGHTFGHALESTSEYQIPHGIAVMVGILIVNRYAKKLGFITDEKEIEIQKIISPYIEYQHFKPEWFDYSKLIEIIKSDKKNTSTINLIISENGSFTLHPVLDFILLEKSVKDIQLWFNMN